MRSFFIALGIGLGFSGAALADPAMTVVPTYMRAQPNSHSAVVQAVPANAQIDVSDCSGVWCAASWRNLDGYVRQSALSFDDVEAAPPPVPNYDYQPGPAVVIPFGFGPGGGERPHENHGNWGQGGPGWQGGHGQGGQGQGGHGSGNQPHPGPGPVQNFGGGGGGGGHPHDAGRPHNGGQPQGGGDPQYVPQGQNNGAQGSHR